MTTNLWEAKLLVKYLNERVAEDRLKTTLIEPSSEGTLSRGRRAVGLLLIHCGERLAGCANSPRLTVRPIADPRQPRLSGDLQRS
ncbi:MAG: hypothetical protein H0W59_10460 [Chloroflexia bacterium]|nr:hypothetical protein [Chloroflexia bacterium]